MDPENVRSDSTFHLSLDDFSESTIVGEKKKVTYFALKTSLFCQQKGLRVKSRILAFI